MLQNNAPLYPLLSAVAARAPTILTTTIITTMILKPQQTPIKTIFAISLSLGVGSICLNNTGLNVIPYATEDWMLSEV